MPDTVTHSLSLNQSITTTGAIVYTSCVRCKDGYLKDEWNQCYNLLGGNVTYGNDY